MKRRITEVARADLLEIYTHIAAHDAGAADRLMSRFDKRFGELEAHPLLGPPHIGHGFDYRRLVVDSYLVFYIVAESEIVILRILHAARDIAALLRRST